MTTRVKIQLEQEHLPVIIEVRGMDPYKLPFSSKILRNKGDLFEEYVHSGQSIFIREMSTAELHIEGESNGE